MTNMTHVHTTQKCHSTVLDLSVVQVEAPEYKQASDNFTFVSMDYVVIYDLGSKGVYPFHWWKS